METPRPLVKQSSSDFMMQDPTSPRPRNLVSNNDKCDDFVLVHESPVSHRRNLRASKELNEEERAELAKLIAANTHLDEPAVAEFVAEDDEAGADDEMGLQITPSPQKRPSFKFGRRMSSNDTLKVNVTEQATLPAAPSPATQFPGKKAPPAGGPESPTAVTDSFFGGMLGGSSADKLLGF